MLQNSQFNEFGKLSSSEVRLSKVEEEVARSSVAKIFFKGRRLVEHHLQSFNEFMEYGLPAMFEEAASFDLYPDRDTVANMIGVQKIKKARILFGEVSMVKPYTTIFHEGKKEVVDLLPYEARLRNMSYSAHLYVTMTLEVYDKGDEMTFHEEDMIDTKTDTIYIGTIPVMVNSSFCHLHGLTEKELVAKGQCSFDVGCYFIIKGSEKVLIAQEERAHQGIYVNYIKRTHTWIATYAPTWRGFTSNQAIRGKTFVKLAMKGKTMFTVGIPGITEPVPLVIVYRALGKTSDKDFFESICYDPTDSQLYELLLTSIGHADLILMDFQARNSGPASIITPGSMRDQILAIRFLGTKLRYSKHAALVEAGKIVLGQLFAHIEGGYMRKTYLLGYMVNQLCLTVLGRRQEEDKDDFKNKRVDLTGQLLSHQFRKAMVHLQHDIKRRIQPHLVKDMDVGPLKKYISEGIITNQMQTAFTLGNWNTNEGLKSSGVVGVLNRMNPMGTLSHLRQVRLNLPTPARPTDSARHPNRSFWGRICPVQTSDGAECGIVKTLALTCVVSSDSPEEPVLHVLRDCGMQFLEETAPSRVSMAEKVLVNGLWVGVFYDNHSAAAVIATLKQLRRGQLIHGEIEVAKNSKAKAVHIHTDAGRLLRPLLIVKDQRLAMSKQQLRTLRTMSKKHESAEACWNFLLEQQVVELLGTEEEQEALIAQNRDDLEKAQKDPDAPLYTHSEIDVSYILGLGASVIPFLEHNQASRNLFQSEKHCKQAMGFYTSNLLGRSDCSGHQLFYPQKPLVTTRAWDYLQKPELTNGQVAIVSIQCYGFNQDDSIVMNRASLDRGLFRSMHFKTYKGEERFNIIEHFAKPRTSTSDTRKTNGASLRKLEDDGFPRLEEFLETGDVIIGKLTAETGSSTPADTSQQLKAHENGRVDQILLSSGEDGHRIAKVRLRCSRRPQAGDKFTSMHGQKGVVGAVFNQEDLPFTQQGIVPDIIINPHAFPSRQTVGQLLESLFGKLVAATGVRQYVTPFHRRPAHIFMDQLHQCGYQRGSSESMCNGATGKRLNALISIGATFYQRLDHMAEDKIKYRGSGGPVNALTRQPVKNRKDLGGVKFGEMERDCMLGHGAAATLRERYFLLSDPYTLFVCASCRRPSCRKDGKTRQHFCNFCCTGKHVVQVQVPYSCKLLWQELFSMGITMLFESKLIY